MKISSGIVLFLTITVVGFSCSKDKGEKNIPKDTAVEHKIADQQSFYGWDSKTLRNVFVRLDVVSELGGKIMGFDLQGYQVIWHDTKNEGKLYDKEGYGSEGSYFNPGGSKVWLSPQGNAGKNEWAGPPDNILDGSPYEIESSDSLITVTSPKDSERTGIQIKNSTVLRTATSLADIKMSLSNIFDKPVQWGIKHVVTLPVDKNLKVFVPSDKNSWGIIDGDKNNTQWKGVDNGMFTATYEKLFGKVGVKTREGWTVWYDADNQIAFGVFFPIDKGGKYAGKGYNVEITTSGDGKSLAGGSEKDYKYTPETANMEIAFSGPVKNIQPSGSNEMNVVWGLCRCSDVKRVIPEAAIVSEEFKFEDSSSKAKFGVFRSGYIQEYYLDSNRKHCGHKILIEVNPLNEVTINQKLKDMSPKTVYIRYNLLDYDKNEICVLGEVKIK